MTMIGKLSAQKPERSAFFWFACSLLVSGTIALVAIHEQQHPASSQEVVAVFPGFTADELPLPGKGLVVTSLRTDSEAQLDGVSVGDTVMAIDRHPVSSLSDAEQVLRQDKSDRVALHILHNNAPHDVVLRRGEGQQHGA